MKNGFVFGLVLAAGMAASGLKRRRFTDIQTFNEVYEGSTAVNVIVPQKPQSQVRIVCDRGAERQGGFVGEDVQRGDGALYRGGKRDHLFDACIAGLDERPGRPNSLLYIQGATSNVVGTVSSSFTTTNISGVTYGYLLMSAAVGIPQLVNAEAEILGTPVTFSMGLKTNNVWASDALFVGNYGRAVYVALDGTSDSLLNAVTVHYDAQSQ